MVQIWVKRYVFSTSFEAAFLMLDAATAAANRSG